MLKCVSLSSVVMIVICRAVELYEKYRAGDRVVLSYSSTLFLRNEK